MNRILVVDDHSIVRYGIIRILEESSGLRVFCDGVASVEEALSRVNSNPYDVALVDISLGDENGFDLLCQLKHKQPSLPVLVVSMHPEEQYAMHAIRLGASGYLSKSSAPQLYAEAVRNLLDGKRYITAKVAACLADKLNQKDATQLPHESLSPRELQVLLLLGRGKNPTEIAKILSLSVKTISTYRTSLLKKMELKTTAELIRYTIMNKLV